MNDNTGPALKKEYTPWESVVWHFKSRKSRLAMAAVITIILTNCSWLQTKLGINQKDAPTIAMAIVVCLGILIGAITGEKIMTNGHNGKAPDPKKIKDEILDIIKDEVIEAATTGEKINLKALKKTVIDSVAKRLSLKFNKRLDKLEDDTKKTLDTLEGAVK